jgi:hypothetical protein
MRLLFLLFAALLVAGAAPKHIYQEGQVWAYQHRPGEAGSRLRINKVDEVAPGTFVYHIGIVGLDSGGEAALREVQHLPVGRETLDSSVTRLAPTEIPFPDFREGYGIWKEAEGGWFTVPVLQILDMVEQATRRARDESADPADPGSG